jgi:hypothetical protein
MPMSRKMVGKTGRQAVRRRPTGLGPRGRGKPEAAAAAPAGGKWTFLTNHSHVLILLSQHPHMVLREVSIRVGITERAVQRIIADLEAAGCIEIEKVGRQNRYRILGTQALRHPIEAHHTIGDLVKLIVGG